MADLTIQYGCRTAQGVRPNNEDRFVADPQQHLFLVADGMGGQEFGERASGLAAEIIPKWCMTGSPKRLIPAQPCRMHWRQRIRQSSMKAAFSLPAAAWVQPPSLPCSKKTKYGSQPLETAGPILSAATAWSS